MDKAWAIGMIGKTRLSRWNDAALAMAECASGGYRNGLHSAGPLSPATTDTPS
jgi:hypothetical protein